MSMVTPFAAHESKMGPEGFLSMEEEYGNFLRISP